MNNRKINAIKRYVTRRMINNLNIFWYLKYN